MLGKVKDLKIVPIVNKAEIDNSNNRVKDFDTEKDKTIFINVLNLIFSNYDGESYMDYVTSK